MSIPSAPSYKLVSGIAMPNFTLPKIGGGEIQIGGPGGWRMVIVYRGKHCPFCQSFLVKLNQMHTKFTELGTDILAISSDSAAKAQAQETDDALTFSIGYDLSLANMAMMGLYISQPRTPEETDRPYAEPGFFLIRPDGHIQIIEIANAPFIRPDLDFILRGIKIIIERDYPIRGTHIPS